MNIFISAGDLSGDIHGAELASKIKEINPSARICALGGDNLKRVAGIFIEDIVHINAFGFLPIKQIFFLIKVFKKVKTFFSDNRPDKIILIDYYGFHIHLAKLAKKLNIDVYYYISPQVWASRGGRVKTLKKFIKKMLVIFPFEEKLYNDAGIDAVFVGNPLTEKFKFRERFSASNPPLIGLFPGSRKDTIKRHIPVLIKTAEILREKLNADFVLFSAGKEMPCKIPAFIKVDEKNDMDLRSAVDIAINPSGTISLENAFLGVHMAVMYKLSLFNYFFIRSIIKVKYITIVNILMGREIIPEFIQFDAKPDAIADNIVKQLSPEFYAAKTKELKCIRALFGEGSASGRAAEIIMGS
ncbi:MAG: hypothetical protein LBH29_07760 [Elusimicrobiota bacterium]|jgi:lipid-A-disaccharide synthase|nr:hypothetical protein [Elusimicrobiota bacterium]